MPTAKSTSTPYDASFLLPDEEQMILFEFFLGLAPKVREHLVAEETGKILGGIAQRHGVPEEKIPGAALAVFTVVVGERGLDQLPALLAEFLQLPEEQMRMLARDIEDEALAPVREELEKRWRQMDARAERQQALFDSYAALPSDVREYLAAEKTGDALRALLTRHDLPEEMLSGVVVALFYALAERRDLAALPELLAGSLQLSDEKQAQNLAHDIDNELFDPIREDMEAHWRGLKKAKRGPVKPNNVLDLRKKRRPPVPPLIRK